MSGWADIAKLLDLMLQLRMGDWRITAFPPFDSLPSAALEQEIDAWCTRLAEDMDGPLDPPDLVKPWICARLAAFRAVAQEHASAPAMPPPELSRSMLRRFLVEEWHGCLRDRWNLLMDLEES